MKWTKAAAQPIWILAVAGVVVVLVASSRASNPVGERLLLLKPGTRPESLVLVDPFGGYRRVLPVPSSGIEAATVAADGSTVATVERSRRHGLAIVAFTLGDQTAYGLTRPDLRPFGRPSWAPGASLLRRRLAMAFAATRNGRTDIFVQATGQRTPTDLTRDVRGGSRSPHWSPKGGVIAFESNRAGNWEIYAMDEHGRNVRRLTHDPATDGLGDWSPDGKQIVFSSNRSGNFDLYVMRSDGSHVRRLTTDQADDLDATWSPDGRWINFSTLKSGRLASYLIRPDGSGERKIALETGEIPQGWQRLADTTPPNVKIISVSASAGQTPSVTYRLFDQSGFASVIVDASGTGSGSVGYAGSGSASLQKAKPAATYTIAIDTPVPAGIRQVTVCVTATDRYGNQSAKECRQA